MPSFAINSRIPSESLIEAFTIPQILAVLHNATHDLGAHRANRFCNLLYAMRICQVVCQIHRSTDNPSIPHRLLRSAKFASHRFHETIDINRGMLKRVVDGDVLHKRHARISIVDDEISVNVLNGYLHFTLLSCVYGINTTRTHCRVS